MRLFHNHLSSNGRRVRMVAEQLGLPLDIVKVDLVSESERARLHEINPNGKLPVLQDGDFMLWESCAIMQYLCDITPGQQLYPQDARVRADVNRWQFWACQHFAETISILAFENIWKGMIGRGEGDPAIVAHAEGELRQLGAVLDGHLAQRDWLVGEALSLADIAVVAPLMYLEKARLPLGDFPNLMSWFERIRQLDLWKNTEAG
ncbi:glutathione S-transferase family protein [Massilia antarctica]|uniref:glutathione S-transferase family protein n=1 Tax=Massilia antarctica TaxID=2765360 RepID=UPI0006BB93B1|nr:glutathione S-transferase family protein [Massilia sp. H27-R4]MCY0915414.1 glutathione S-transferase family protein [Massilia sp. H27-R4]CUI05878.1 Putative glutathione S-transferase [Janthinobacterium sp. CG23_2]CUU29664.1 Putative glutathione S-transferase [Janthinobacterium sp. CG23_2]